MADFDKALVVTHIVFRKAPPYDALEGPYSSVCNSLKPIVKEVQTCQIPLSGFNDPLIYGPWKKSRKFQLPPVLGKLAVLKYVIDVFIAAFFVIRFNLTNRNKKRLVIGVDPLSCLPLVFFKKLLGYKLVFHSVDFNKNRFKNKLLQKLYERADEISAKFSDQTWVVCESLQKYKKKKFNINSFYMPNSPIFNDIFYKNGRKLKTGNKMAWTGSFLTNRQYEILFGILKEIQEKFRPDMEFHFAPMQNHDKFRSYGKRYGLKKFAVLELHSRLEWQKYSATCDVGIAVYDEEFGSTEFIEPTKIWDFMLCGMPFIISSEPSISTSIKKATVAFILEPHNKIPNDKSLHDFLRPENLKTKQEQCLKLAKKYDIKEQIKNKISLL